ncbi:hypothetical protein HAX54_047468 [Datura stramonium]|uniref:Uncharacterized protein n=1 Tax=Datura stramonium TaxID=4076 RepID=A0ABS8SU00_DATST|nr:hypothetical protein [Datura stramonium]
MSGRQALEITNGKEFSGYVVFYCEGWKKCIDRNYCKLRPFCKTLELASSLKNQDLPAGYRPVRVKWKDLDKCATLCHMDEVHARCYGEQEPMDGILWLCNLCRPGLQSSLVACALLLVPNHDFFRDQVIVVYISVTQ